MMAPITTVRPQKCGNGTTFGYSEQFLMEHGW